MSLLQSCLLEIKDSWFLIPEWLGGEQVTSHYPNQWRPSLHTYIYVTQLRWIITHNCHETSAAILNDVIWFKIVTQINRYTRWRKHVRLCNHPESKDHWLDTFVISIRYFRVGSMSNFFYLGSGVHMDGWDMLVCLSRASADTVKLYIYMYVYIHIYIYICVCVCVIKLIFQMLTVCGQQHSYSIYMYIYTRDQHHKRWHIINRWLSARLPSVSFWISNPDGQKPWHFNTIGLSLIIFSDDHNFIEILEAFTNIVWYILHWCKQVVSGKSTAWDWDLRLIRLLHGPSLVDFGLSVDIRYGLKLAGCTISWSE